MKAIKTGLMTQEDDNAVLASLRKAFGPPPSTKSTLEQQLQSLPPEELQLVLSTAYMVKRAHGFKHNNNEPYLALLRRMYPRLNMRLQNIIAAILNDADPLVDSSSSHIAERDISRSAILNEYTSVIPTDRDETFRELDFGPNTDHIFMEKMVSSESSGDPNAEITLDDGRTFTGLFQMGEERLDDCRQATGTDFTTQQFKKNLALQHEVTKWHFADINEAIAGLGNDAVGYDENGLKAVAHIGGIGGMK